MSEQPIKGVMLMCAEILCGGCGNWWSTNECGRRTAAALARQTGWRWTRALGWRCPVCIHEEECGNCTSHGYCREGYRMRCDLWGQS